VELDSFCSAAATDKGWLSFNTRYGRPSIARQKNAVLPRKLPLQRWFERQYSQYEVIKHRRFHAVESANQGQGILPSNSFSSAGLVATAVPISVAVIGVPAIARTPRASGNHHKNNIQRDSHATQGRVNKHTKQAASNMHSASLSIY